MVIKSNSDHDERGLLPYPVIVAATKGDPDAMKIVLNRYDSNIRYRLGCVFGNTGKHRRIGQGT